MTAAAPDPELKLLSSISGRQRWFVPALKDRPRLAAAVEEAIVREAPGVAVRANPITGRVLLEWRQPEAPGSTRELVVRALRVKPLTETAFIARRGEVECGQPRVARSACVTSASVSSPGS